MQKTNSKRRWLYLSVGTVMMMVLGLIYAWSIFVKPLENEFGWNRAQTSLTFTLCISFFVIGLLTSGAMSQKLSKRALTLIAATCMLAGFVICSRVHTLLGLYLSYGVLVGFGVGIANNALVSTIVRWFPEKTGLASGILMMGFGMGSMVLGPLAIRLMDVIGWRSTFRLFGIAFFALLAAGSLSIVPPCTLQNASDVAQQEADPTSLSSGQVLRRASFWLYIGWFTLVMAGGLIVIGHAAPFAADIGFSAASAALATGILSLSNGLGRILSGLAFDRLGLRKSMGLTTLYLFLGALFLCSAAWFTNPIFLLLGFVLTGLSYGGGPTTSSTFASSFYGSKHFAMNYALVSTGMIPGALLGPFLAGNLRANSGGYISSFITMLIFACTAFLFLNYLHQKHKNS